MSTKCRPFYLNTKNKILRLHGFLTLQPCFDDSVIARTLSNLVDINCFVFSEGTGGGGRGWERAVQAKSREMGLGLILENESAARRQ